MSAPDPFDALLRRALRSHDIPPVPPTLVAAWRPVRSDVGARWLWLAPSGLFAVGLVLGVWLAPLGLTAAFTSLRATVAALWQALPPGVTTWGLALLLAVAVLALDGARGYLLRRR